MWKGRTVVILGGGPSLANIDFGLLRGERVIATNNAYKLGSWECLYFMDRDWWRQHREAIQSLSTLKVTILADCEDVPWVRYLRRGKGRGYDPKPDRLTAGGNAGYGATGLAIHFGGTRILLAGFDMQTVGGHHNWHFDHKRAMQEEIYDIYIRHFDTLRKELANVRPDVEIINCTPGSAMTTFPFVPLAEALGKA